MWDSHTGVHVSDPPAKREDLLDAVAASVALVWQVARCLLEDKNHAAGTYWQGGKDCDTPALNQFTSLFLQVFCPGGGRPRRRPKAGVARLEATKAGVTRLEATFFGSLYKNRRLSNHIRAEAAKPASAGCLLAGLATADLILH